MHAVAQTASASVSHMGRSILVIVASALLALKETLMSKMDAQILMSVRYPINAMGSAII